MAIGASRGRNDDRRQLRDDVSQGQPANRHVLVNHRRQPVYCDDSKEEKDFLFADHRPARGGGRHARDYERDSGDFKLNVDIPFFSGNLNIEDFINWLVDIYKFYDYMEVPKEKRVRLLACRLKAGASAWWERLQTRMVYEEKHPVRTCYRIR